MARLKTVYLGALYGVRLRASSWYVLFTSTDTLIQGPSPMNTLDPGSQLRHCRIHSAHASTRCAGLPGPDAPAQSLSGTTPPSSCLTLRPSRTCTSQLNKTFPSRISHISSPPRPRTHPLPRKSHAPPRVEGRPHGLGPLREHRADVSHPPRSPLCVSLMLTSDRARAIASKDPNKEQTAQQEAFKVETEAFDASATRVHTTSARLLSAMSLTML